MKIGIITIHKSEVNYGACLQSYALWKSISDMGHDTQIIDLLRPCHAGYKVSPSFHEKKKSLSYRIKRWISSILKGHKNEPQLFLGKRIKFEEFNRLPNYTRTYYSVEELYKNPPVFDLYITGSDQVWNPQRNILKDPYFLTFVPKDKKKISYASSFALEKLPEEIRSQFSKWLSSYECISTREQSGAHIVKELTEKESFIAVDPVFLLSGEKWNEYAKKVEGLNPHEYIFLYLLHYNEEYIDYAASVAKEKKMPLYIVLSANIIVDKPDVTQLIEIGPKEWLWLIHNSSLTITSSFHGSAFCIIFDTPFTILMRNGITANTRITDLLSNVKASFEEEKLSSNINALVVKNYSKEELRFMIDKSYNYLATNLK